MSETKSNNNTSIQNIEESSPGNMEKGQLLFSKLKIYVEIFNKNIDQSDILDDILNSNGAEVSKKLTKNLSYIIFKDGKPKTAEYALNNGIKLLNPLWVHESITKNKIQKEVNYIVKKSYTDLYLQTTTSAFLNSSAENLNKKRKFDQLSKSPNPRKEEHESKKKKVVSISNTKKDGITISTNGENKINSGIENPIENKPNNKITNFFKPSTKIENKPEIVSKLEESEPSIKLCSIGIGEENKFKILHCTKNMGKYVYLGDKMENIKDSEFVVVNEIFSKNDARYVFAMMNNKKLLDIKYFIESKSQKCYKETIQDYLKDYPLNLENTTILKDKILPFEENKYKFYIHPSIYEKEPLKQEVITFMLKYLGVEPESNIRLSEICILNKEDSNEHYPGHVRLLNEIYLFDCFYNFKVMDFENLKYHPEKVTIKKIKENIK